MRALESITVSNTNATPVKSSEIQEDHLYKLKVSGTVSDWCTTSSCPTGNPDQTAQPNVGVDALYCYAKWRCGDTPQLWRQLQVDELGINQLADTKLVVPYSESHVYTVEFTGVGAQLSLGAADAVAGSTSDNSGSFKVELTDEGPVPGPVVSVYSVSNGCGGAGWATFEKTQNYLGNTSVYADSNVNPLAKKYIVNFKAACDNHDAGYGGAIVIDRLRGGIKDFRHWTRKQVDDKFLADMRFLCHQAIPESATTALANCLGTGGNASVGAESRYNFVRRFGGLFFDANIGQTGTQKTGPRNNN